MARKRLHKFDFKGTDRFLLLDNVYTNIETQTGITLVTDPAEGGKPTSVTDLVREGSLVKISCSVTATNELTGPVKNRTVYADVDSAESALGSILGKQIPSFGTIPGGFISSARIRARRRLR